MRGQPLDGASPGQVIGARYVVEQVLEREPWGWLVAAAEREERRRRVLLKLFVPDPAQAVADVRELAEQELGVLLRARSRWGAAHVAAPLENDVRSHEGLPLIVLSLVSGASLADRIARAAPLAEDEALRIGAGVARGLAAIHAAGGYHGALSPEGIVLRGALDPVLRDIGLVKAARALRAGGEAGDAAGREERGGAHGIDARHAAPEQLAGEQVLPASDVYTLGVVVYTMLTGQAPLCGRSAAETRDLRAHLAPPAPRIEGRRIGGRAAALVLRCLERDPERRPSAAEVARALAERGRPWGAVSFTGGATAAVIATSVALGAAAPAKEKPASTESTSSAAAANSVAAANSAAASSAAANSAGANGAAASSAAAAVRRDMLVRLVEARRKGISNGTAAGANRAAGSRRDGAPARRLPDEPARGVTHTGTTITLPHAPRKLAGVGPVKALASGRAALVVTASGQTLAWDADAGARMLAGGAPLHLGALDVRALAGGIGFPLLVGRDGSVKTWRRPEESVIPVSGLSSVAGAASGTAHVVALHTDGTVSLAHIPHARGLEPAPVKVAGLSGVIAVAAGTAGMSFALEGDGDLWRWRYTNRAPDLGITLESLRERTEIGALERVEPLQDAVAIAVRGNRELLALDRGGVVHRLSEQGWERVEGLPVVKSISSYSNAAAAVDERGAVWIWGRFGRDDKQIRFEQPARLEGLPPVRAVDIGSDVGLAIDRQGSLWGWGAASVCDGPSAKELAACK